MSSNHTFSRRTMLRAAALGGVGLAVAGAGHAREAVPAPPLSALPLKGNLKQAVSRWTYGMLPLDELCRTVKRLGFSAIDQVSPHEWHILKAHGVTCSLCEGAETGLWLAKGFANPEYHEQLLASYTTHIDLVADAGYRNLICFSGNRNGMDPAEGMANAEGMLKRILGQAEKRGVRILMELLNSKVDHPDYLCDSSAWGVELCKRLGSPNFGLLYDIYHMQIMEGDIIATIRKHHEYFMHYHTAGVPGRHEIGAEQELNYPAICRAIVETGFDDYLSHEFRPTAADPVASLREAVLLCDV